MLGLFQGDFDFRSRQRLWVNSACPAIEQGSNEHRYQRRDNDGCTDANNRGEDRSADEKDPADRDRGILESFRNGISLVGVCSIFVAAFPAKRMSRIQNEAAASAAPGREEDSLPPGFPAAMEIGALPATGAKPCLIVKYGTTTLNAADTPYPVEVGSNLISAHRAILPERRWGDSRASLSGIVR